MRIVSIEIEDGRALTMMMDGWTDGVRLLDSRSRSIPTRLRRAYVRQCNSCDIHNSTLFRIYTNHNKDTHAEGTP